MNYEQCIKHLKEHLPISHDKDLIIDPHASQPAFMDGIQTLVKFALFYHKNPVDENVLPLDFLNVDFGRYEKTFLSGLWYDAIHIISEPPPAQAEQFIIAACKFSESVSLIMPPAAEAAFPPNYKCLFSTAEKKLVFQIWKKC